MHGIGNDYIYFDCFEKQIDNPEILAVKLSDRHKGIGGDGVVLILPSNIADAKMRMFNADGSEGKMCGNAIRCVAKYLYDKGLKKQSMTIETASGIKTLGLKIDDGKVSSVTVNMGVPILDGRKIPCGTDGKTVNYPLEVGGDVYNITAVSMGNPHAVIFVKNVAEYNVSEIGAKIENHPFFPDRVNAEFVEVLSPAALKMRVYERGSGETMACGTGACASAVAAVLNGYCDKNTDVTLMLLGGDLIINYTEKGVYMTGTADKVFEGEIEL